MLKGIYSGAFGECIEQVGHSFYCVNLETYKELFDGLTELSPEDAQKRLNDSIIGKVIESEEENYDLPMPFGKDYRKLFLKRKYGTLGIDKSDAHIQMLRLNKESNKDDRNCSANDGNHAHFVNVVAYTTHLI
jgi:hypothetical protein